MASVSEYNVINDPPLPDGWMKSVLINGDTIYHNKGATKITKNLPTQTENPVEIDNDASRQAIKAALQKAEHEAATSTAKVAPAHAPAPAITLAPVAASTPVAAAAHAAPVAPAPAPPSVGVAQLFVKWKDKSGNNISARDQCQQIVDAVKCLVQKGYERVGLTYSANQKPQTQAIFGAYKFNPVLTNNNFDIGVAKTITETGISGANQAATLTQLDDLTDDAFRKVFRIIPLSTMEIGGGGKDVDEDALGKSSDCLEYVKQFLALDKSIILGWCDQYTEKELSLLKLSDTNPDELKNINKLVDDAYTLDGKVPTTKIQAKFTKVTDGKSVEYIDSKQSVVLTTTTGNKYLPKRKKHINIGGDMAEKTKNTREIYIPAYLKFLVGRWNRDAQLLVDDCQSASPEAAPAAAHPAAHTPALIPIEKKPFADVLTGLEGQLSKDSENDTEIRKLGITLPKDFLYPPDGGTSVVKKNLNSAKPAIGDMIAVFETADGGETNFYLGACRSIQAAYELEFKAITGDENSDEVKEAKMRAKLLLNLRKNSLLLKVPARWDYATMTMGEEAVPELEPPFSVPLQNESSVFCFENVAFQLLFSIDSVRKFSENPIEQIDAKTLCKTLNITSDIPKCEGVFENTYDVLHKMSEQYKKDKSIPVEAEQSKKNLEQIKNKEVTEVYTQDGSQQADAADFLVYTILQYLKLYEPINNSICFKQYELTLCNNDINDTEIKRLKAYKFDITKYEQVVGSKKKTYDFSKNSVLQKIGVKIDNKRLLDILNPVGDEQSALMCFTHGNSIQECIDDYLITKDLVKNDDKGTETGHYQYELAQNSTCSKDNTIKRPVLYIPETQKYLIVILKRYTLKEGKTIIVDKNINVDEKITINKDIEYVNKYEFKLRGVICKTGSAGGGHYVYISYEDDKKILYNDSAPPADFNSGYNMNKQGYVFLYEKVTSQTGGSNNIPRSITYTNAAITNHTASKSRHNSSFKASSSKSKGKSRSHTQRVK